MGYQHPDKTNVTGWGTKQQKAYWEARAKRVNLSLSSYVNLWHSRWFELGCPNLLPLEDNLPQLPFPGSPAPKSRPETPVTTPTAGQPTTVTITVPAGVSVHVITP